MNVKIAHRSGLSAFLCLFVLFAYPARPRQKYPEWKQYLFNVYSQVFVDSYAAKLRLDSLLYDARIKKDAERMAHTSEIYGLVNLFQNDSTQAKALFKKAETYFEMQKDYLSLGDYESRKAIIIFNKLRFREAEILFLKSLNWYLKQDEADYKTAIYYQLGTLYNFDNRQAESIKMYTTGLKLAEETKNLYLMCEGNLYLGALMMDISPDEKAGHYLLRAKDYAVQLKDSVTLSNALYYLSNYYHNNQQFERAMLSARQALSCLRNKINSPLYGSLSGMVANILLAANKPDSALIFGARSLRQAVQDQNKTGILGSKNILARAYLLKNEPSKTLETLADCYPVMRELGYTSVVAEIYKSLSEAEFALGKTAMAYGHLNTYVKMHDSIYKKESQKQIAQVEASFQNEKKQMQIEALNKDMQARNQQISQQNKQKAALGAGLLIACGFGFFIWKGYKRKKKDNHIIRQQHDKMEEQKILVEVKNREIMDSIAYAKRLQDAILPSPFEIASSFKETFILYEPKEIVAGDFYWIAKNNNRIFLAVCDCTGHGVPGAMLSVVGHNALQRCVNEFNLTDPGKILDHLSKIVEETFSHTYKNVRDGMDISLVSFKMNTGGRVSLLPDKKSKNSEGEECVEVQWAGANNPIWFITSNGEFKEIKGDKQPIGKYEMRKPFTTHSVTLKESDCIYLFSDGFADQFGGQKGKKFKYARLKELLLSNHRNDMQSQLGVLDGAFRTWKGSLDQIDDVCVIGVRI